MHREYHAPARSGDVLELPDFDSPTMPVETLSRAKRRKAGWLAKCMALFLGAGMAFSSLFGSACAGEIYVSGGGGGGLTPGGGGQHASAGATGSGSDTSGGGAYVGDGSNPHTNPHTGENTHLNYLGKIEFLDTGMDSYATSGNGGKEPSSGGNASFINSTSPLSGWSVHVESGVHGVGGGYRGDGGSATFEADELNDAPTISLIKNADSGDVSFSVGTLGIENGTTTLSVTGAGIGGTGIGEVLLTGSGKLEASSANVWDEIDVGQLKIDGGTLNDGNWVSLVGPVATGGIPWLNDTIEVLSGGATIRVDSSLTLGRDLSGTDGGDLNVEGNGSLTVSRTIDLDGSLIKNDSGHLTLSSETLLKDLIVYLGQVDIAGATGISQGLTVHDGRVDITWDTAIGENLTVNAGEVNITGTTIIGDSLIVNDGQVDIKGATTIGDTLRVIDGQVKIAAATTDAASVAVEADGELTIEGAGRLATATDISNEGLLIFDHTGGAMAIDQIITGSGTLRMKSGEEATLEQVVQQGSLYVENGKLILESQNNYSGVVDVSLGAELEVQNGLVGGASIQNEGDIYLAPADTMTVELDIAGGGSLRHDGANTTKATTLQGEVTQKDLSVDGGKLILAAANNYSAGIGVSDGAMLEVQAGLAGGDIQNEGTLFFNLSGDAVFTQNISGAAGTLTHENSGITTTLQGVVQQDRLEANTGTLVLLGDNTYYDQAVIADGAALQVGAGGTAGSLAADFVYIENGAALRFERSDTIEIDYDIRGEGGGSVTQAGIGTITFSGVNFYNVEMLVEKGVARVESVNAVFDKIDVEAGAALQIAGAGDVSSGGLVWVKNDANLQFYGNGVLSAADAVQVDGTIDIGVGGVNYPQITADSITLGANSVFNLNSISSKGSLSETVYETLMSSANPIAGNFQNINVGGFTSEGIDYLTLKTKFNEDEGRNEFRAYYHLAWYANNNLAHGDFTIAGGSIPVNVGLDPVNVQRNNDAGWDGNSLTKKGPGALVLAGDNTYTGPTNIVAGTLAIGSGGATGTLASTAIANAGILEFNRSGTLNIAGAISGSGQLVQKGSGVTTLFGSNSYTGRTDIMNGTLALSGTGSLGATSGLFMHTGSRFDLSARSSGYNSLGALTILGPDTHIVGDANMLDMSGAFSYLAFDITGIRPEAPPLSLPAMLAIDGMLLIDSHTVVALYNAERGFEDGHEIWLAAGMSAASEVDPDYRIISTGNRYRFGLRLDDGQNGLLDLYAFIDGRLTFEERTEEYLGPRRRRNRNTKEGAEYLDQLDETPGFDIKDLDDQFEDIRNSLDPDLGAGELERFYGGYGAYADKGLLVTADRFNRQWQQRNHFALWDEDFCSGAEDGRKTRIWAGGLGAWARQSGAGGLAGYRYDSQGAVLGIERVLGDCLSFGFAAAYSDGDLRVRELLHKNSSDIANFALYGAWTRQGGVFVSGGLGYGHAWNRYTTDMLLGGQKHGKYGADLWSANVEAGYAFQLPSGFSLTPSIAVEYAHIRRDTWTEWVSADSPHNNPNRFDSGRSNSVAIPLTLRVARLFDMANGYRVKPEIRVAWVGQPSQVRSSIGAGFAGAPGGMTMRGVDPGGHHWRAGAGVSGRLGGMAEISADYDFDARRGMRGHHVALTVGVAF